MKKIAMLGFSMLLLCMIIFPVRGQASVVEPGALTLPPPDLIQPFTLFDPNFIYLERGGAYISELSNGNVKIWGDTAATVYVDEIGVGLTLQRWTGTVWVDVISGTPGTDTDSAYMYHSHVLSSVARGYYYRTKAKHWIKHGNVNEAGTRHSGSILLAL